MLIIKICYGRVDGCVITGKIVSTRHQRLKRLSNMTFANANSAAGGWLPGRWDARLAARLGVRSPGTATRSWQTAAGFLAVTPGSLQRKSMARAAAHYTG